MKMSTEMIEKEKKIRETEKLYMGLREMIAKQPGPEALVYLNKTRRALRERGKKMKVCTCILLCKLKENNNIFKIFTYLIERYVIIWIKTIHFKLSQIYGINT